MSTKEVLQEFRAPSKGTWRAFLICGVLLFVWAWCEVMIVNAMLAGEHPISSKEPGAVPVWTVAGFPLLIWFFWLVFGSERIMLRRKYLTIRFEIAGLGLPFPYPFDYDVEAITDIRFAEPLPRESKGLIAAPRIKFSYRGSTIGFGSGLQTQEALNIISVVKRAYHIR